jgi:hypothetical protein
MLVSMTSKCNSHYYVTTVDLRSNTVTFRESLGNFLNPHQFALARCIATGIELLRCNLNVNGRSCQEEWRVLQSCNVTKQEDGISCGVIAIIYSLMICSGQENKYQIPFENLNLIKVRKLIVKILGDGILPRDGCEITPIRPDRYGFTAVYKDRVCPCFLSFEGADGSSSLATHPHVTVCQFVTLAGKKCLGLALKEPYFCSQCQGCIQHLRANICKHCDAHSISVKPMTAPTGHSVIDIFSDCSGTVNIPEAHEVQPSMYGAKRNILYLSVNRVSSAMQIWLPVQYLRLLKTGAAAVGSETRTSSKRISALVSAASSDGKRYINHDFKPGGICDPEENVSNVQKIRVPLNIEDKDNKELILQTPQILGETLQIANRRQHVVGIVNDHPSNTCWFNVLIQSFCWNDDVALAALTYLTTNSVEGEEVLNIN